MVSYEVTRVDTLLCDWLSFVTVTKDIFQLTQSVIISLPVFSVLYNKVRVDEIVQTEFPYKSPSDPNITTRVLNLVHLCMCDSFNDPDWRWLRFEVRFNPTIYLCSPSEHYATERSAVCCLFNAAQCGVCFFQKWSTSSQLGVMHDLIPHVACSTNAMQSTIMITNINCIDRRKYFDSQKVFCDSHNSQDRLQDLARFNAIITIFLRWRSWSVSRANRVSWR